MKVDKNIGKNGIKYEVIKAILLTELSNSSSKYWSEIYSEFSYDEKIVCSVYFTNSKEKKEVIFQIADNKIDLEPYNSFIFSGGKVIQIKPKEMSDNIYEIRNKIIEVLHE
jgi:hypothetical protein